MHTMTEEEKRVQHCCQKSFRFQFLCYIVMEKTGMKIAHHMFKKSRWWNNKVNDIHNNTALRFAHTNKKMPLIWKL